MLQQCCEYFNSGRIIETGSMAASSQLERESPLAFLNLYQNLVNMLCFPRCCSLLLRLSFVPCSVTFTTFVFRYLIASLRVRLGNACITSRPPDI